MLQNWFGFHVGDIKEICEQEKVACIHSETVTHVLHGLLAIETLRLHVVCRQINDYSHDHLQDLNARDENADESWDSNVQSPQSVIRIHERVHRIIHHHEPSSRTGVIRVTVPNVGHNADVVVPVEEN